MTKSFYELLLYITNTFTNFIKTKIYNKKSKITILKISYTSLKICQNLNYIVTKVNEILKKFEIDRITILRCTYSNEEYEKKKKKKFWKNIYTE